MAGIQKTTIIGNLGSDPEMRYTPQGTAVTTFSVAVNERRGGGDGERQETTTWFRVSCWNKLAEVASAYLKKGRQVYVEGPLRVHEFTGNDGRQRYSLEITAREFQMLGGSPGREAEDGDAAEAAPRRQQSRQKEDVLDDIPF
jgi:single-strand DNA-binding protein